MQKRFFFIIAYAILAIYAQALYAVKPHEYNWDDLPGEIQTHVIGFLNRDGDGINRRNLLVINKTMKSIIEEKGHYKISPLIKSIPVNERVEYLTLFLTHHAQNIRTLYLENCALTDNGMTTLSGFSFPDLEELNLRENDITHVGAMNLSKFICPNLKKLNLRGNPINNFGIIALSQSNFPELHELNLREINVGSMGGPVLSSLKFPNLRKLNLRGSNLGQRPMVLDRLPFLNLKKLDLRENGLDDESIEEISRGNFQNLEELYLSDNNITEEGASVLKEINLPKIVILDLINYNARAADSAAQHNIQD